MAAQIMKGMSVPGQLNSDNDHEISTGLTYTLVTNYLQPLTEDALENMEGRLPEWVPADEMFTADDIKKLPEFQKMQKQIDKEFGIERVDSTELQRLAEEEARRQEEERRRRRKEKIRRKCRKRKE